MIPEPREVPGGKPDRRSGYGRAPEAGVKWRYEIQYGPEANYAWVYAGSTMVGTFKTHHAIEVVAAMNRRAPTDEDPTTPAQAAVCRFCKGRGTVADYVGLEMNCVEVECDACGGADPTTPEAQAAVQDTWFTDSALPIMAMSGDTESDRVLKLHFRRPVNDDDRKSLIDALNIYQASLTAPEAQAGSEAVACPHCNDTGFVAISAGNGRYLRPGPVPDDARGVAESPCWECLAYPGGFDGPTGAD